MTLPYLFGLIFVFLILFVVVCRLLVRRIIKKEMQSLHQLLLDFHEDEIKPLKPVMENHKEVIESIMDQIDELNSNGQEKDLKLPKKSVLARIDELEPSPKS